jgi:hypothetical protein
MRTSFFSPILLATALMAAAERAPASAGRPAVTKDDSPKDAPAMPPGNTVDTATGERKFVPRVIRHVTVETLKVPAGTSVYVKILAPMAKAKKAVGRSQEPATLLSVKNLETGKDVQLVVPSVLRSILSEEFEGDSYVKRCFAISKSADKKGQTEDRKYYSYTVDEIEDPDKSAS